MGRVEFIATTAVLPMVVPVDPRPISDRRPRILAFDSGIGGLSVLREIRHFRSDADIIYVADDIGFPYGDWEASSLIERIVDLMDGLIAEHAPDLVVIACNTASTLVLPALRARHHLPFVGTVPAVKPAAETTRSGLVTVLATPGSVKRDYTRALIETYASHIAVTLVGSTRLAAMAEAELAGTPVDDTALAAEIAACFVTRGDTRTDTIVLACTHYPFLLTRFRKLSPWDVTWIDPAPAIARRVLQIVGEPRPDDIGTVTLHYTSGRTPPAPVRALIAALHPCAP